MKAYILAPYLWSQSISNQLADSWPWDKDVFGYDPSDQGVPPRCAEGQFDDIILGAVRGGSHDLVVYVSMCPEGNPRLGGIPTADTFHKLRDVAPVLHLCCDGGDDGWRSWLLLYEQEDRFDATVNVDGCLDWPLAGKPHCWAALTPIVFPGVEVRPLAQRGTNISFCGAVSGWRPSLVEPLREMIGLDARGARHEGTYADYFTRLADSRLTLNIPWSGSQSIPPHDKGVKHVKGRVLEAGWAGCCLLEMRGAATASWFIPGEDYAEYTDAAGVVGVSRMLLADLPRAQALADNLRRKVTEDHNPLRFWERVLAEVGLNDPVAVPGGLS